MYEAKTKLTILDDAVAQRSGLLTVNLLLNTHQLKKADVLFELLQTRLNIAWETFTSDEEDDSDVAIELKKEKPIGSKSLDIFKWMFRLYKIRNNVLNGKIVLIPHEDTAELSILRAHQFYNGIDYQMAAKELAKEFRKPIANIK